MTLKEKIITMADETAKELETIPEDINNTPKLRESIGKLRVLNELMRFMVENNM